MLIVPEWKSAYFWPLLTPDGKVFYDFVKDCLVLDPYFISTENSIFSGFVKFHWKLKKQCILNYSIFTSKTLSEHSAKFVSQQQATKTTFEGNWLFSCYKSLNGVQEVE